MGKKQLYEISCPFCKNNFQVKKKRENRVIGKYNSILCPICKKAILLNYNDELDSIRVISYNTPIKEKKIRIDLSSFRPKERNKN